MPLLNVENLQYGYRQALFDPLSFCCQKGTITAILGANGRGKTTLLHTIIGTLPPLAGTIQVNDTIGFVPQSFTSHFSYDVLDIVLMGRVSAVKLLHTPSREDENIALEALNRLGLNHLAHTPYNTLSGGQKQLVIIARALAIGGNILVLDEPAAALDLQNQLSILNLMHLLAKEEYVSIIFTTHEPSHALMVADNTLLLMPDQQWIHGNTASVLTEDNLFSAYGVPIRQITFKEKGREYTTLVPLFSVEKPYTTG